MLPRKRTVKVAVVGSGLAGLTAAYRMVKGSEHREVQVEVHLFEKAPSLGMDTHSISVPIPGQKGKQRIDVPMRSFQGGYYPQLISLYRELGVSFRVADFSYSFSTLKNLADASARSIVATMIYNGASGTKGISMPSSMLSSPSRISLWSSPLAIFLFIAARAQTYATFVFSALLIGAFYLRLIFLSLPLHVPNWLSKPLTFTAIPYRHPNNTMTLQEWQDVTTPSSVFSRSLGLDTKWRKFVGQVLIPLFSAVCTAGSEDIWNHPVEEFLDYIYLTLGTHHYVVLNGVQDVVHRITASIPPAQIHTGSAIVGLEYQPANQLTGPRVTIHCSSNRSYHGFSHVVFATQANHGIPLLKSYLDTLPTPTSPKNPSDLEKQRSLLGAQIQCLTNFKYVRTVVVNHTDSSLLPSCARDRRDLNLIMASPGLKATENQDSGICVHPSYAMATHVLPKVSGIYQTTNPIIPPSKDSILSVARLERAIVTPESKVALSGLWRETKETGWRWGCAGQDNGLLGPLQGAGVLGAAVDEPNRVPGIWLCGSFVHCGIPLLEGCVVSATNVVEQGIWKCEGI